MEFIIDSDPRGTRPDGFYVTIESTCGDGDYEREDTFGPFTETAVKLLIAFIHRFKGVCKDYDMTDLQEAELSIWDSSRREDITDDVIEANIKLLQNIDDEDIKAYNDTNVLNEIKQSYFEVPYDGLNDAFYSLRITDLVCVRNGLEYDVRYSM